MQLSFIYLPLIIQQTRQLSRRQHRMLPIAETPASGVTFVSTPTNNSSVGADPVTPQTNAGINQLPNVIGDQTDTSGN
jgi:hypothetical protein